MLGQGVRRRTHCALRAPFKQLRQVSARSACVLRHTHAPLPCASRRSQKGTQNGHPHEPLLRCAALGPVSRAQAPRAAQTGPSAAMARRDIGCLDVRLPPPLLAAPAAGRLRGGMGVAAPMLRALTRRGCLNEAATQRSEFHGAPHNRHDAGLPRSEAQGSQTGGRLSFRYFFLAKQRKVPRPPGRQPGSRPQQKHAPKSASTTKRYKINSNQQISH